MNELDKIIEISNRNLAFELYKQKMSKDAIIESGISKKEPLKIQSDITKEMIEEHHKELKKPIEIEGKLYKYVPSSIDIDNNELENIEAQKISLKKDVLEDEEIKNGIDYKLKLLEDKKKLEEQLKLDNIFQRKNIINFLKTIEELKNIYPMVNKEEQKKIKEKINLLQNKINKTTEHINLKNNPTNIKINDINDSINLIDHYIKINDNTIRENERIEQEYNKKKLQVVKTLADDLKLLNMGRNLEYTQRYGETEEDYLKRLKNYTEEEAEKEKPFIEHEVIQKFKKNMREIIRREDVIESIIRLFMLEGYYIEKLFELNKIWQKIKNKFNSKYGIGLKLDITEYFDFLNKILMNEESKISDESIYLGKMADESTYYKDITKKKKTSTKEKEDRKKYKIRLNEDLLNNLTNINNSIREYHFDGDKSKLIEEANIKIDELLEQLKKLTDIKDKANLADTIQVLVNYREEIINAKSKKDFKILEKNLLQDSKVIEEEIMKASGDIPIDTMEEKDNSFVFSDDINKKYDYFFKLINEHVNNRRNIYNTDYKSFEARYKDFTGKKIINQTKFNDNNIKNIKNKIKLNLINDYEEYMKDKDIINLEKPYTINEEKVYKGWGLKKGNIKYGKLNINIEKLRENNILSVKDNNNVNIQGFKNKKVSDNLVDIILDLINNKKPNKLMHNNISEEENILLDKLLYLSKKHKGGLIEVNIKGNIDKKKKQLEIIIGEIEAGNNGKLIKEDLYYCLSDIKNLGGISTSEMKRYYNDIINNYFK